MLGSTYTDLRRGTALVKALLTHEITEHEFQEEADYLEPEAAQVLATALALSGDDSNFNVRARGLCLEVARRCLNRN
jgi:hypothetical protein